MKASNKKLWVIIAGALVAVTAVAIIVITRNDTATIRSHDNWMPADVDWTVYIGDDVPAGTSGFEDDYFVQRNSWDTYRKKDSSWKKVGKIVELEGVQDSAVKWVNQLYSLYCQTNRWYKGTPHEWAYDLRDGFLFETTYYDVNFYGEKDAENPDDEPEFFGTQKARRRETITYEGKTPVKAFDEDNYYTFKEWDHSLASVNQSFDTYALFEGHDNGTLVKPGGVIGFDEEDETKKEVISLLIPEEINGEIVTTISDGAFSDCINLEYVELPSTIEYIGEHAFFACPSLKEIFIPKNVSYISEVAFSSSLYSLKTIEVDEENEHYKDVDGVLYTKDGQTIMRYPPAKEYEETTYTVGDEIRYISSFCFADFMGIEEFVLPNNLIQVGTWAFKNTDINALALPDNCKVLSGNFISGCLNLETISVGEDNVYYSSLDGVLYTKDLTELFRVPEGKSIEEGFDILASVTSLGTYCLSGTNIIKMDIPSHVNTIRMYSFSYIETMTNVYIPLTVTSIESRAFYSCHELVIDCEASEKPIEWAADWAHYKGEEGFDDENDTGYVKEKNWGVTKL